MPKFYTSLTMCVEEILEGKMNISDVEFVLVTTAYFKYGAMLDQIRRSFMGKDVTRAVEIATTLWYSGRIFQSTVPSDTLMPTRSSFPINKVFSSITHKKDL